MRFARILCICVLLALVVGCQSKKNIEIPMFYNGTVQSLDTGREEQIVVKPLVGEFLELPAYNVGFGNSFYWHAFGRQFESIAKDSFQQHGYLAVINNEPMKSNDDYETVNKIALANAKYSVLLHMVVKMYELDDSATFGDRVLFALIPAVQYKHTQYANMDVEIELRAVVLDSQTGQPLFNQSYVRSRKWQYPYNKINQFEQLLKTRGKMFADVLDEELSLFWKDFVGTLVAKK